MKFKAVYLGHCRFLVNKSEKKIDKIVNTKVLMFFLFLHENICCGYSLEVPHRGTSNEYPQHSFHGEIRKILSGYPSY